MRANEVERITSEFKMDVIKGRIVNCFSSFFIVFHYSSLHLRPIIINYFSYFSTRIWLKISRDNRLLPTGIASKQFNHLLYRWKHAWYHNYKVELEYPKKSSHPWPNIKFAWFYELVDCHRFNFFSKQVDRQPELPIFSCPRLIMVYFWNSHIWH